VQGPDSDGHGHIKTSEHQNIRTSSEFATGDEFLSFDPANTTRNFRFSGVQETPVPVPEPELKLE